jgi:hypothetical protein
MSISQTMKTDHSRVIVPSDGKGVPQGTNDTPGGKGPGATATATRDDGLSPSVHESVITRHLPRDPRTPEPVDDSAILRMANAVASARVAAERAGRAATGIMQNELMTVAARHRATKEKAWKLTEPVLRDIDSALASARRDLETLEQKTAAPAKPTDAGGYFLATEVRQRLAAMPEPERESALGAALKEGDDQLLGAVLAASPMLTGISKKRQDMLRASWQKAKYGPELERIARLQKAISDTERAGTLAMTYTLGLSNEAIIRRAEASERAMREALET